MMSAKSSRYLRFAITGALGTASFYGLILLLVEVARLPVMISTSAAFLFVVLQNYLLHYHWTFTSARRHRESLPRFAAMSFGGFNLNALIMYVGVELISFNYLLVQTLSIAAVVCWNYILSSRWVFRDD